MTTVLPTGHPVFFKKLPKGENTTPNAEIVRLVSHLKGAPVYEVLYRNEKWLCKRGDMMTCEEANAELADRWNREINVVKADGKQKAKEIAKALRISQSTLRKRLKFIQNHKAK